MGRPRTWTDDDLRAALDGATSMREVVLALRLVAGGASHTTVRTRVEQLGLPVPRPAATSAARQPWRRTFSEEELRQAARSSASLHGVFQRLGLQVGGGQWSTIRALIVDRGWSTEHWVSPLRATAAPTAAERFQQALGRSDLAAVVAGAGSRAEVIRLLGAIPSSGRYRQLATALADADIDVSHLEERTAAMRRTPRRPRPLSEVLVRGARTTDTHRLKLRLIDEGVLPPRCASCGGERWLGVAIPLQLDHIDGDRTHNRLENLRLLCPNCHAQTDTYCGKNIGRARGGGSGGVRE